MIRIADPASQSLNRMIFNLGIGSAITNDGKINAVRKYLDNQKKKREKMQQLCPACLEMVRQQFSQMSWVDSCFENYVVEMFAKADVSQLETFYHRFKSARDKNQFFLSFVKYEL